MQATGLLVRYGQNKESEVVQELREEEVTTVSFPDFLFRGPRSLCCLEFVIAFGALACAARARFMQGTNFSKWSFKI